MTTSGDLVIDWLSFTFANDLSSDGHRKKQVCEMFSNDNADSSYYSIIKSINSLVHPRNFANYFMPQVVDLVHIWRLSWTFSGDDSVSFLPNDDHIYAITK